MSRMLPYEETLSIEFKSEVRCIIGIVRENRNR